SYAAPPPIVPRPLRALTLRRANGTLRAAWAQSAGALRYRVAVRRSDGERFVVSTRARHVAAAGFSPAYGATVTVTPLHGAHRGRARRRCAGEPARDDLRRAAECAPRRRDRPRLRPHEPRDADADGAGRRPRDRGRTTRRARRPRHPALERPPRRPSGAPRPLHAHADGDRYGRRRDDVAAQDNHDSRT